MWSTLPSGTLKTHFSSRAAVQDNSALMKKLVKLHHSCLVENLFISKRVTSLELIKHPHFQDDRNFFEFIQLLSFTTHTPTHTHTRTNKCIKISFNLFPCDSSDTNICIAISPSNSARLILIALFI